MLSVSLGLVALMPNGAGAQQGQNPGAITEATAPSKAPTLITMSQFAGTWACRSMPGGGSYEAVAAVSPQRNAFTIRSPKWRSVFTSPGDVLQLRSSDAAGAAGYTLAGYVPHRIDLTFESTLPGERPGATPENTFAHTFEIKRYRSGFVITKKSPKFGTITETCKPS